ncbi:MAG: phosphatidate cytidylyltransferase [Acidobacteria bacterium]|nr:phosphatidate cytidylyltransferase [Acidobacteriota bacterium]MCI0720979.1 phosphatidate cytidylyltransferase [Acidobacteriota bacterium]
MRFQVLVIFLWFLFLPALQRLLDFSIQKRFLSSFAARKISHLAVGLWVIPLAVFVREWYLVAVPITMILAANVHANLQRGNLGRLEKRLFPLAGFLLPLVLILYFWHQQRSDLVVLAVLTMTVGDTAAALVGIHFGKHRIPWTGKTVEGAVANFISSLAVLAWVGQAFYHMPFNTFPLPAAVIAVLEAVLPGEWDNPLTVVVLLVMLRYPLW